MMVVYMGLEDEVEGGDVVVAELNKIQFRQSCPDVRVSLDVRLDPVVRVLGENRARDEQHNFGLDGSGEVEIERICGWKRVGRVGKARSTRSNTNPWTKSNKISTHQEITKKIGAIFGGDFRI